MLKAGRVPTILLHQRAFCCFRMPRPRRAVELIELIGPGRRRLRGLQAADSPGTRRLQFFTVRSPGPNKPIGFLLLLSAKRRCQTPIFFFGRALYGKQYYGRDYRQCLF